MKTKRRKLTRNQESYQDTLLAAKASGTPYIEYCHCGVLYTAVVRVPTFYGIEHREKNQCRDCSDIEFNRVNNNNKKITEIRAALCLKQ